MRRNVGTRDRLARLVAAVPLLACSVMAPLPLIVRILALAAPAGYLGLTALSGRCACYAMTGKSTCPVPRS
jgi:hypothetical protein